MFLDSKTIPSKRQSSIASFLSREVDQIKGKEINLFLDHPTIENQEEPIHSKDFDTGNDLVSEVSWEVSEYFKRPSSSNLCDVEERYDWIIHPKDCNQNEPSSTEYDPSTIYIPPSQWREFTPFEEQYWKIKSKLYDTIVFFKKGKFYELYEKDSDVASSFFDLKITDRVNMKMAGVPEATIDYWTQKFIAAGFKVAKVDQCDNSISKVLKEKTGLIDKKKIIQREMSYIMSPGTTLHLAENESNCLLSFDRYSEQDYILPKLYIPSKSKIINLEPLDINNLIIELQDIKFKYAPCEIIADKRLRTPLLDKQIQNVFNINCSYLLSNENGVLEAYLKHLNVFDKQNLHVEGEIEKNNAFDLKVSSVSGLNFLSFGSRDSLFNRIDFCLTPFGRRMLKVWISNPGINYRDLMKRQNDIKKAIAAGHQFSSIVEKRFKSICDLDKFLTLCRYPDFNFQKFEQLIMGLLCISEALIELPSFCKEEITLELENSMRILKESKENYNSLNRTVSNGKSEVQNLLDEYLTQQKKNLRNNNICFRDVGKEKFTLEVPANVSVPSNYQIISKTKVLVS
jgi:DNA mismatch repair protein MSH6